MLVRDVHLQNAKSLIAVTESGMVTLVRERQSLNADSPMLVTTHPLISAGTVSSFALPV